MDDIFAHEAALSDGYRVAVDHAEALLEDGVLTLCGSDLFLSKVTGQVHLQLLVNNEARSAVMNVFSVKSALMQVNISVSLRLLSNFRVLSGNIVSESTEFLDGDGLASNKVLPDVRYQRLPNNDHLRLRFKRLLRG